MRSKLDMTKTIVGDEAMGALGWGRRHRRGRRRGSGCCPEAPEGCGSCARRETVRLSDAGRGRSVEIVSVEGDEAFRGKMMALGIVAGAKVRVTQGGGGGPVVVALNGGRILLDRNSTARVAVSSVEDEAGGTGSGRPEGSRS